MIDGYHLVSNNRAGDAQHERARLAQELFWLMTSDEMVKKVAAAIAASDGLDREKQAKAVLMAITGWERTGQ